jgi:hypothetical protein
MSDGNMAAAACTYASACTHVSARIDAAIVLPGHPQVLDPSALAHFEVSALKDFVASTLDPSRAVLAASGRLGQVPYSGG